MTFVGISRDEQFSPCRQSVDTAIFNGVVAAIEAEGYDVVRLSEAILIEEGIPEGLSLDGIFHMTRSDEALEILETVQRQSVPIVNTPLAVRSCRRVAQTEKLSTTGFFPYSAIIDLNQTKDISQTWNRYPCWVKRGDAHSIVKDDVQYVTSSMQCYEAFSSLKERGIHSVVLQDHIPGILVKFYGVRRVGFFHSHQIESLSESKFCLERFNDQIAVPTFDPENLKQLAEKAASILDVDIYGGDAVISANGNVTIIDFNDWPSFSCCVDQATKAIAELIISQS